MKGIGLAALVVAAACGGGSGDHGGRRARPPSQEGGSMVGRMPMGSGNMMMGRPAPPGARASATAPPPCPSVSAALVDRGRGIFLGAGNCYLCHGRAARGTRTGPDLADASWLDSDGSYPAIAALVRAGVPYPKQFPAPMPVRGGAALDEGQVCAVAAYVYSLSH